MPTTNDHRPADSREGRDCDASRRSTARILFPDGRPGSWVLALALAYLAVVTREILVRIA